jgi:hypothetical protein
MIFFVIKTAISPQPGVANIKAGLLMGSANSIKICKDGMNYRIGARSNLNEMDFSPLIFTETADLIVFYTILHLAGLGNKN